VGLVLTGSQDKGRIPPAPFTRGRNLLRRFAGPLMGSIRGMTGRVRDGPNNNLLSPPGERIKVRGGL